MRHLIPDFISLALLLLPHPFAAVVSAQEVLISGGAPEEYLSAPGELRRRTIDFDRVRIGELPHLAPDTVVDLDLFPDATVRARFRSASTAYRGGRVTVLETVDDPLGCVVFSELGGCMRGYVQSGRDTFTISDRPNGRAVVAQLGRWEHAGATSPAPRDQARDARFTGAPKDLSAPGCHDEPSPYASRIDVMVPYTNAALASYAGGEDELLADVNLAVAVANESFAIALTPPRLNLVHVYRTPTVDESTMNQNELLDHLKQVGEGEMDEVHFKRHLHGADVVVLLFGGLSGDGEGEAVDTLCPEDLDFEDRAFGAVRTDAMLSKLRLSHVIGHMLGAQHEIWDPACASLGTAHSAVTECGEFRTIMSTAALGPVTLKNVWSTPSVFDPHGHAYGGSGTNNAQAIALYSHLATCWEHEDSPYHEVETRWDGSELASGTMFDLIPRRDVQLTGLSLRMATTAPGAPHATFWMRPGGYSGGVTGPSGWVLLDDSIGVVPGEGEPAYFALDAHQTLQAGERYGIFVACDPGAQATFTPGTDSFENLDLRLELGLAKGTGTFGAAAVPNRQFNGIVHYTGADGESRLETPLAGPIARTGFVFQVDVLEPLRLHGFDVHLLNDELDALDVFYQQGTLSGSVPYWESWTYLGTDTLVLPAGSAEWTRATVPSVDLAPGSYLFSVSLASGGSSGQRLLGSDAIGGVSHASVGLAFGYGFAGALFGPATPAEAADVALRYSTPGPYLAVSGLVAGGTAAISVSGGDASGTASVALSAAADVAIPIGIETWFLSAPTWLPPIALDSTGAGSMVVPVAPSFSGLVFWLQGVVSPNNELTSLLGTMIE